MLLACDPIVDVDAHEKAGGALRLFYARREETLRLSTWFAVTDYTAGTLFAAPVQQWFGAIRANLGAPDEDESELIVLVTATIHEHGPRTAKSQ